MESALELEEPEQQQRDPKEAEDDNESIDFVHIDQSEKDNSDQETSEQEEDQDQEHHHLVEGTDGGGGEHQQERNLTDWSFDGTMDSSSGGQSEQMNWHMAALTAKNQMLEEQLNNKQMQIQIAENGVKFAVLEEKNKALESQLENAFAEREKAMEEVRARELNNVQLQAQIVENGVIIDVLKEKNKMLESQLKNGELREKALLEKVQELNNGQLQAQIAETSAKFAVLEEKNKALESQLKNAVAEREKELEKVRERKNVQLRAQIVESGAKFQVLEEKNKTLESQLKTAELREKAFEKKLEEKDKQVTQFTANLANLGKHKHQPANVDMLKEKNKMLESQLKNVELREKALEKKLEEKDKQVAQFTQSLSNLGKQLATLSGNSTNKIQLHLPLDGNQWNPSASSPIFAMNSVGSAFISSATGIGGGIKWHHAFALKGFPVLDAIMKKGQPNNVNSNKTTVLYYEVRIVDEKEHDHYHAIGLSMGYNKDYTNHVGLHPNSYGLDEYGQAYYVCGKVHQSAEHMTPHGYPIATIVSGHDDTYGFGLLVKPNKELAIFATINGMLVDQQVPIQFWSEFLYPTVSVSKLSTKVKANFGNNPTVPFRYDIANCPGLQL